MARQQYAASEPSRRARRIGREHPVIREDEGPLRLWLRARGNVCVSVQCRRISTVTRYTAHTLGAQSLQRETVMPTAGHDLQRHCGRRHGHRVPTVQVSHRLWALRMRPLPRFASLGRCFWVY
jgi:hypothetical protein